MTTPTASSLRDLLRDSRLGSEAAARALYGHAAPPMRAYANAILSDRALAEDATQQAFLRMLREPVERIETLREPLAWLLSLVRSEALTMFRSRLRADARERERQFAPADPTEDEAIDDLRRAIDAIAPAHRELLVLKHVCELTFDQIAIAMDLNRSTAASRYSVAVEALRRQMTPAEARQEAKYA